MTTYLINGLRFSEMVDENGISLALTNIRKYASLCFCHPGPSNLLASSPKVSLSMKGLSSESS
jgi:hypothetical protein